jgi:glycosyltransferase involved in cell wall biosynthesis
VPRVSVVIPVHDRADRIRPTLDSVRAQTFSDLELIVVDDGSTDGVADVVSAAQPTARIVRLDRNTGASAARNRGVAEARGELIAFLDSDDLWSPDKLALQVDDFDRYPDASMSFTDVIYGRTGTRQVYSRAHRFQPDRLFEQILEGIPILPSAILLRKRDFERVGGFDAEIAVAEDRDLYLRLAAIGPLRFLGLPLVRRVVYPDALSHRSELWETGFELVITRFLERPEGRRFRERAHELYALQLVKVGSRHLGSREWVRAASCLGRASVRDPLALFRRPARRVLAEAIRGRPRRLRRRPTSGEPAPPFRPPPDAPPRP